MKEHGNREVNIFNMSLLDILCGTLGAFCFLMLALLPDHLKAKQLQEQIDRMSTPDGMNAEARAKKAEQDAEEAKRRADEAEQKAKKARAQQSLAYFQVLWDGPQDVDLWVKMPDKKWVMPKKAALPKEQLYAESRRREEGAGAGAGVAHRHLVHRRHLRAAREAALGQRRQRTACGSPATSPCACRPAKRPTACRSTSCPESCSAKASW